MSDRRWPRTPTEAHVAIRRGTAYSHALDTIAGLAGADHADHETASGLLAAILALAEDALAEERQDGSLRAPAASADAGLDRARAALEARLARFEANPCLAKLRTGEPFFVLIGRDPEAAATIRHWATLRILREGASDKTRSACCAARDFDAYRTAGDAPQPGGTIMGDGDER